MGVNRAQGKIDPWSLIVTYTLPEFFFPQNRELMEFSLVTYLNGLDGLDVPGRPLGMSSVRHVM